MKRVFLLYHGEYVHLPDGETIIGRDIDCRLRFNDPSVSRHHLRISVANGRASAVDLGSTNGTLLNNERLEGECELDHRDRLRVGVRELSVHFLDDALSRDSADGIGFAAASDTSPDPVRRAAGTWTRMRDDRAAREVCGQCGALIRPGDSTCRACGDAQPEYHHQAATYVGSVVDRRSSPRHAVDIPVVYSSDSLRLHGIAKNLSLNGVFISSEFLDPVGTPCDVTVMLDGAPAVELSGRVCRTVAVNHPEGIPPGVGIQFETVDEQAKSWLWSTLKKRMAR